MDLLARREHSRFELTRKLVQKGFESDQVDIVLEQLFQENLLSDERYTEVYIRSRAAKGFGPLKIRVELQARGVTERLVHEHFTSLPTDFWQDVLETIWAKKCRHQFDGTMESKAKCIRFLQHKGFAMEDIFKIIESEKVD